MTNHTPEPCPWCGCKEIEISFSEICCPIQYSARGRCTECYAEDPGGSGVFDSKEDAEIEALASWNDRPADQIAAVTARRDEWQPMETAPKNTTIILDVGLPWAVFGVWNAPSEKWCYANLQSTGDIPPFNDTYFENEHEKAPKAWMPMPEIKREVK